MVVCGRLKYPRCPPLSSFDIIHPLRGCLLRMTPDSLVWPLGSRLLCLYVSRPLWLTRGNQPWMCRHNIEAESRTNTAVVQCMFYRFKNRNFDDLSDSVVSMTSYLCMLRYAEMTSSTKLEVHSVLQCHQRMAGLQPQEQRMYKRFREVGQRFFLRYTCRWTDRQTDTLIAILCSPPGASSRSTTNRD